MDVYGERYFLAAGGSACVLKSNAASLLEAIAATLQDALAAFPS